ncbi:hypothetical protein Tco_1144352 [Tanacetum coccineum]
MRKRHLSQSSNKGTTNIGTLVSQDSSIGTNRHLPNCGIIAVCQDTSVSSCIRVTNYLAISLGDSKTSMELVSRRRNFGCKIIRLVTVPTCDNKSAMSHYKFATIVSTIPRSKHIDIILDHFRARRSDDIMEISKADQIALAMMLIALLSSNQTYFICPKVSVNEKFEEHHLESRVLNKHRTSTRTSESKKSIMLLLQEAACHTKDNSTSQEESLILSNARKQKASHSPPKKERQEDGKRKQEGAKYRDSPAALHASGFVQREGIGVSPGGFPMHLINIDSELCISWSVRDELKSQDDQDDDDEAQTESEDDEDQGNEADRDTNANLEGRDDVKADVVLPQVQVTQEIEDTHVTLTPVSPDGQQQSSSVSSGFVSNMLNPTRTAVDVAVQNLPGSQIEIEEEAQAENQQFLDSIDEGMKKVIKEQVKVKSRRSHHKLRTLQGISLNAYEADKILLDTYGDIGPLKDLETEQMMIKNPPLEQTGGPKEEGQEKNLNLPVL